MSKPLNKITSLGLSLTPLLGCFSLTTSCSCQASYWTGGQKDSLGTLKQEADRLWTMDLTADLKLDEVITSTQKRNYYEINRGIHDAILPESPYIMPKTSVPMPEIDVPGGCTSFATHNNRDQMMVSKNFDWFLDNSFGFLVKNNAPDAKYKSIGIVNSDNLVLECGFKKNIENLERFLYAPYYVAEGMNDQGLVVNSLLLHYGSNHMDQHIAGRQNLTASFVPQTLLSNCATVQECVKKLDSYNLRAYGAPDEKDNSRQWLIADKNHWMGITYINNKMVTYSNLLPEEREALDSDYVVNRESRLLNLPFYELPVSEEDKDPSTHPYGWLYGSTLLPGNEEDRFDKEDVNKYLLFTNFYENVKDDEMVDNPQPRFKQELYGKEQTFFRCGDNGFWRYEQCHQALKEQWKKGVGPTEDQAMDILDKCSYILQDGDLRALRWKHYVPFKKKEDWICITFYSLVFNTNDLKVKLCLYEDFSKEYQFQINKN